MSEIVYKNTHQERQQCKVKSKENIFYIKQLRKCLKHQSFIENIIADKYRVIEKIKICN